MSVAGRIKQIGWYYGSRQIPDIITFFGCGYHRMWYVAWIMAFLPFCRFARWL